MAAPSSGPAGALEENRAMDDRDIRELLKNVAAGRLSRRALLRVLLGAGRRRYSSRSWVSLSVLIAFHAFVGSMPLVGTIA